MKDSLFGSATPTTPSPIPMPDPMDPAAIDAKRRAMVGATQRGRAATQLTQPLAAGLASPMASYAGTKTGG